MTNNNNPQNDNNNSSNINPTSINITERDVELVNESLPADQVTIDNLHIPSREEVLESLRNRHIQENSENTSNPHIETLTERFEGPAKLVREEETIIQPIVLETIGDVQDYLVYLETQEAEKRNKRYSADLIREYVTGGNKNLDRSTIIPPKLFFQFTKNNLSEVEIKDLDDRLYKFQQIFNLTSQTDQLALKEQARREILLAAAKQLAASKGYTKYMKASTIKTLINHVKDVELNKETKGQAKILFLKPFREFPRLLPTEVQSKVLEVTKLNLFKEFWVLFLDYTDEKIQSTAEKIKEKDPILFGKLSEDSDELFFIIDWIDEYCDLTLEKLVAQLHKLDTSYVLPEVTLPTAKDINKLLQEETRQKTVLKNTNSSNYRDLSNQEKNGLQKTGFVDFIKAMLNKILR